MSVYDRLTPARRWLLALGGCFLVLSTVQAEVPYSHEIPTYTVSFIFSNPELAIEPQQLTARAIRVLPKTFKALAPATTPFPAKRPGQVTITTTQTKPYCDTKHRFCWFKEMAIDGDQVKITSFDGQVNNYRAQTNLGAFFWQESLEAASNESRQR